MKKLHIVVALKNEDKIGNAFFGTIIDALK